MLLAGLAIVLIAVAAGVVVVVKSNHDASVRKHKKELAVKTRLAEEHKREEKEHKQEEEAANAEKGEKLIRQLLVHGLEKAVTKDAKHEVETGSLEGPILHSSCEPVSGASPDDLTNNTGTYKCIAVTKVENGEESGYRYTARVNFKADSYSWHLGGE